MAITPKSAEAERPPSSSSHRLTHEDVDALATFMEPDEIELLHKAVDQLEEEAEEEEAENPGNEEGNDGVPGESGEPEEPDEPEEPSEPDEPAEPDSEASAASGEQAEELREIDIEELPPEALELIEHEEGSPPDVHTVRKVKGKGPARWQVTTSEAVWRITKSRSRWSITPEEQSEPAAP